MIDDPHAYADLLDSVLERFRDAQQVEEDDWTVPRSIRVGWGPAHKIIRMITGKTRASVRMPAGVGEDSSSRHDGPSE